VKLLARFVATGAFFGYAPIIPGTFGTIPAVFLAPLFARLSAASVVAYLIALLAAIAVAIWAAGETVRRVGHEDPQIVVVDEVVGYLVTVAFLPATPAVLLAGFVAFRFFDIVKPPPARRLEGLHGGLGVVADDLYAGVLAHLAVRAGLALDLL